jgi:hypothetical protein
MKKRVGKHPSEQILSGKWQGYTPPPMRRK